jgi:hypothetical protein
LTSNPSCGKFIADKREWFLKRNKNEESKTMNNNSKLYLHCGAERITREDLVKVPTPAATETWQPIPHFTLVEQVEKALTQVNMHVVEEAYGLTKSGARMFGLLQVANGVKTEDYGYMLGLRNSHDKSFPAKLGVGSRVFVCDNLALSAEIEIARKHTLNIMRDLPILTLNAISRLAAHYNRQGDRIEAYKRAELDDRDAESLMTRWCQDEVSIFPKTKITEVYKEWHTPKYPEFAQAKNVWRLFNGITECLKGAIWQLSGRTERLHALCDQLSGVKPIDVEIVAGTTDAEAVVNV